MILGLFLFFPSLLFANTFCVQTFNVYGPAYASSVEYRLELLAEEIKKEPCDSYQFQELWKLNQFQLLQNHMEKNRFAMLWADTIRNDQKMIGLGSAFQGSILKAESGLFQVNNEDGVADWFRGAWGVEKGYSILQVQLDNSPKLQFVNTHTHPTNTSIRIAQIVQLLQTIGQQQEDLPIILTGDLNATPESLEYQLLTVVGGLQDSYFLKNRSYKDVCTYCGSNPLSWSSDDRVIDYVFYQDSSSLALEVEKSKINLQGRDEYSPLSDHFGIQTHFRWAEKSREKGNNFAAAADVILAIANELEDSSEFESTRKVLKRWYKEFRKEKVPSDLDKIF